VTSSPSFRRELPTSKVAGGISMGLNSPRPEGNLSFMLSHLTLRMQARMKQYAIRPLSLLSASGQINILREIITFSLAFIPYLAKGEFPLANVKLCSLRVSSLFKDRVTELRTCGASIGVYVFLRSNFCFSFMFFPMFLKPPNQLLRCPSRNKPTTEVVGS